jgi:hypothetical protein
MKPTYSFIEIRQMLPLLDANELDVLLEVCTEETNRYAPYEFVAINRMILVSKKKLAINEVQMEYLLSFN